MQTSELHLQKARSASPPSWMDGSVEMQISLGMQAQMQMQIPASARSPSRAASDNRTASPLSTRSTSGAAGHCETAGAGGGRMVVWTSSGRCCCCETIGAGGGCAVLWPSGEAWTSSGRCCRCACAANPSVAASCKDVSTSGVVSDCGATFPGGAVSVARCSFFALARSFDLGSAGSRSQGDQNDGEVGR